MPSTGMTESPSAPATSPPCAPARVWRVTPWEGCGRHGGRRGLLSQSIYSHRCRVAASERRKGHDMRWALARRNGRLLRVAVSAVIAGALAAPGVADAAAPAEVGWSKCHADLGPFECGTVQVPLDYGQPNGGKISIALVRLPATDPARRIGSLFLKPGGPRGGGGGFPPFS